jgi:hypothetical protein
MVLRKSLTHAGTKKGANTGLTYPGLPFEVGWWVSFGSESSGTDFLIF